MATYRNDFTWKQRFFALKSRDDSRCPRFDSKPASAFHFSQQRDELPEDGHGEAADGQCTFLIARLYHCEQRRHAGLSRAF